MKLKIILLLIVLLTLTGCFDQEELVRRHNNFLELIDSTGEDYCKERGLFYERSYSNDLENYYIVCYHNSPYMIKEYWVGKRIQ